VADRSHRFGGGGGQVSLARAGLIQVDLLQRHDIGIELLDGVGQPVQLDAAVVNTASVQDVEGGHPHGYYLPTMTDSDVPARNDELREALKRAASALKAQGPEFALAALLLGVRAVREQVNWDQVRRETADNEFAEAFLFLTDRLGITT
jgi:hypothetical protein